MEDLCLNMDGRPMGLFFAIGKIDASVQCGRSIIDLDPHKHTVSCSSGAISGGHQNCLYRDSLCQRAVDIHTEVRCPIIEFSNEPNFIGLDTILRCSIQSSAAVQRALFQTSFRFTTFYIRNLKESHPGPFLVKKTSRSTGRALDQEHCFDALLNLNPGRHWRETSNARSVGIAKTLDETSSFKDALWTPCLPSI